MGFVRVEGHAHQEGYLFPHQLFSLVVQSLLSTECDCKDILAVFSSTHLSDADTQYHTLSNMK